jgi:ABC-2 type transport system permease protein
VTLLLLYVLSWPAASAGTIGGEVLKYLSVIDHFSEMVKGVIDTKDLFYFATLTVFCLFLTQRSVESSRWR